MFSVIEELYYGNLQPGSAHTRQSGAYAKAARASLDLLEKLHPLLSEEGNAMLERFADLQAEQESLITVAKFIVGFQLGMLLAVEVFGDRDRLAGPGGIV